MRGRAIAEKSRVTYHNFILKQFIPYLKKNGIKEIEQIDTPLLSRFQKALFKGEGKKAPIKPQIINHYISYVSLIFDHLIQEGNIKINPCKSLICLKINDEELRGCYEITKLKGVFNKKWKDEFSYLLCLLIYTTGMRNSEIENIKVLDLIEIENMHFIDIIKSKTKNGIRKVPLHDFVYRKIMAYVKKAKKNDNDLIFSIQGKKKLGSETYSAANLELAVFTKYSSDKLEKENITFYSGRHYFKTLMDSENLGDIEEYFMGHKISSDVVKRYNHKDKQGRKKLLERTRRVFQILDKHIFTSNGKI
jgi:integrase